MPTDTKAMIARAATATATGFSPWRSRPKLSQPRLWGADRLSFTASISTSRPRALACGLYVTEEASRRVVRAVSNSGVNSPSYCG